MTTFKNCTLCFYVFEEEDLPCYPPKLPEICGKYLHSSLTQEILSSHSPDNVPFCPKCLEYVMELYYLNDQLECYQKRISELLFIRSLEILHRRGKNPTSNRSDQNTSNYNKSKRQLIEFDVSGLPNCDFRKIDSDVPEVIIISVEDAHNFYSLEDVCEDESTANVDMVIIEKIKVECDEFGSIDESHKNNVIEDCAAEFFNEKTKQNSDVSPGDTGNKRQNPSLKLQKMKFCDSGRKIVLMDNKQDNVVAENSQMKLQSIWTKSDFGYSYKKTAVNKTLHSDNRQISALKISVNKSSTHGDKIESQFNQGIKETFQCVECDEKFQTKQELDVHSIVHSLQVQQPPYAGEQNFKWKGYLRKHKKRKHTRIDLEDRPHSCELCGKRFKTKSHLRGHIIVHTGERPYKCEICDKGFTKKCDVKRHERVHSGLTKLI